MFRLISAAVVACAFAVALPFAFGVGTPNNAEAACVCCGDACVCEQCVCDEQGCACSDGGQSTCSNGCCTECCA